MFVIEEGKDYVLESGEEAPLQHIRYLGSGSSCIVDEVRDIHSGSIYARKTFRLLRWRNNDEVLRVFRNETNVIRNLPHHHIVRIISTFTQKDSLSLILEPSADGEDLAIFLEDIRNTSQDKQKASPMAHSRNIDILEKAFGCLASGLVYMHRNKFRHKDIKPGNILIHAGSVLYTDFGYSLDSTLSDHSTTTGPSSHWTERYAAPEAFINTLGSRNSRSDVFSLGCVYIEMLSVMDKALNPLRIERGDTYANELDRIHALMKDAKIRAPGGCYETLSEVCIGMTQRKILDRPTALQVLADLQKLPGILCAKCLATLSSREETTGNPLSAFSHSTAEAVTTYPILLQPPPFPLQAPTDRRLEPNQLPRHPESEHANYAFEQLTIQNTHSVSKRIRQKPSLEEKNEGCLNDRFQWVGTADNQKRYFVTRNRYGFQRHWDKQQTP